MEFYFGKVDLKAFENVEKETLFTHNGNYFWNKMVINGEGICFYDTCDRHMPFDRTALKELEVAVYIAREHDLAEQDAERAKGLRLAKLDNTLARWQAQDR